MKIITIACIILVMGFQQTQASERDKTAQQVIADQFVACTMSCRAHLQGRLSRLKAQQSSSALEQCYLQCLNKSIEQYKAHNAPTK